MARFAAAVAYARAHPRVADAVLAVVLFVLAVAASNSSPDINAVDHPGEFAGMVVLAGSVGFRRVAPIRALAVGTVAQAVIWALGLPDSGFPAIILAYTAASTGRQPAGVRAAAVAAAALTAWTLVGVVLGEAPLSVLPIVALTGAGAVLAGDNIRTRRAYLAELEQRAERAEALRSAEARQAAAEERSRIARELHDVVAHSVSVMVVQAGAARRIAERDPARAADALGTIETVGRESLHELRRILGVLRQSDDGDADADDVYEPQPDLDRIGPLLDRCGEAGLDVTLVVDGPRRHLPPGVELTAYRIVQESLTNVLKHAGPASASVALTYAPDGLVVEVVDDGRGAAATAAATDPGHGIAGMRERVAAFGGTLVAGPRPGGGYRVRAQLPVEATP